MFLLAVPVPAQELHRESWPGGQPKVECETALDASGARILAGAYRAWYESGALRAEGKFADDRETGRWTFYHENGTVAQQGSYSKGERTALWESAHPDGKRASKGKYTRGARDGAWSFWNTDGTEDEVNSGSYASAEHRSADDSRLFRGPLLDGQRHGEWTSFWPDLEPALSASYVRGQRHGPWIFRHQDGSVSSTILSGLYQAGRWVAPLPADPAASASTGKRTPPPGPAAPVFRPAPEDAEAALEALLAADEKAAAAARKLVDEQRGHPDWTRVADVPVLLSRLLALDPEDPEARRAIGRIDAIALRAIARGNGFVPFGPDGPPDAQAARERVRSWASLWAATRANPWFWRIELPFGSPPENLAAGRTWFQEPELLELDELSAPRLLAQRAKGPASLSRASARALEDALTWLAAHQDPSGGWSCGKFSDRCGQLGKTVCRGPGGRYDVGVTGLALLAFLGAGNTLDRGPHREVLVKGIGHLLETQDARSGRLLTLWPETDPLTGAVMGHIFYHDWLYEHGIATAALCEALATSRSAALRASAERAVEVILQGRNPYGAWRYEVPGNGDNDSSVTGWMVYALRMASEAGIVIDAASFDGALAFLDEVSDPANGRVGYSSFGTFSSRSTTNEHFPREKGEALTAVGLLSRLLLGQGPETSPILAKHAQLILTKPPVWDPEHGGSDFYYWYYASSALHQMGKPYWPAWEKALKPAVVDTQRQDGDERGSWDPIDAWGYAGGRVYSTALMALILEAPFRLALLTAAK